MRSTGGGRETRRAWSLPGWPNTTPVIVVRLPSIQRMARKAKTAAGCGGRAGLDADEAVVPEQCVGVVHGAGDRQRRARCGDDAREHRQAHGPIDDAHLVGGGRHGRVVVAARVGVAVWVMPSDRAVAFIRATNRSVEPASHRARTAAMLFADGSSSACSACSSVNCSAAMGTTDSCCRRRRSVSATSASVSVIVGPSSPTRSGWLRSTR